jgi:hypothetical protein
MKALLLRSLLVALLVGLSTGFVSYVESVHGAVRYEPPLSEAEVRELKHLPIAEMEAALQRRRISLTRKQWLVDSIGYSYFWTDVAKSSVVPIVGVFLACVCIGGWERRDARRNAIRDFGPGHEK